MIGKPLILVVDDEPQIQRFLRPALAASGYDVELAHDAASALRLARARGPDLVVLDLGLPDRDGKLVIGELRQRSEVPIIVLSAHDQEAEKVAALDLGAHDFITKPFGIQELLARIRVCRRSARSDQPKDGRIRLGDIVIDGDARWVENAGVPVRLTPTEFELLTRLAQSPGRVLRHRQILTKIWRPAHVEDTPYPRGFIGQLRQKIEANPSEPKVILTEPGVGNRTMERG